jgi:hypothetical protein
LARVPVVVLTQRVQASEQVQAVVQMQRPAQAAVVQPGPAPEVVRS